MAAPDSYLGGGTDAATNQGGGTNVSNLPLNRASGRGKPAPNAVRIMYIVNVARQRKDAQMGGAG
jgi:hypothetical protein